MAKLSIAEVEGSMTPGMAPARRRLSVGDVEQMLRGPSPESVETQPFDSSMMFESGMIEPRTPPLGSFVPSLPSPPPAPQATSPEIWPGGNPALRTMQNVAARRAEAIGQPQPPPAADPELAAYYEQTGRGQRTTDPLKTGYFQTQQNIGALGADAASRFGNLFDQARAPVEPNAPQLRGRLIDLMRAQTPEQAADTRGRVDEGLRASIDRIIGTGADIGNIPQNPALLGLGRAKSWGEAAQQFWRDPLGVVQAVTLQSLPQAAPGIAAGMVAGPAAGAAVMGGTSYLSEYASTVLDELAKSGVDVRDPAALRAAFSDPNTMMQLRSKAAQRAAIIGAVDAATMGVASKTLAPRTIRNPFMREAVNIPAQVGAQGAMGGGAEAGAQLATEGRITEPGQVVAEVVGEAGTAPAEVAALARSRGQVMPRIASGNERYRRQSERIEPTLTPPPWPPESVLPPALSVETMPVRVRTDQGDRDVIFPDALHRRLFEYGQALRARNADPAERARLYDEFKGWVLDSFEGADDVDHLADDYVTELTGIDEYGAPGQAGLKLPADGRAHIVVDSDLQADYWRGKLRPVETARPAGSVPGSPASQPPPAAPGPVTQPPSVAPLVFGQQTVVTPRGRRIEVVPDIVEASDLIASHTDDLAANPAFPADLQPRDRERAASAAQVQEIAGNLQPELLGLTGSVSEGAPIIGPDRVVESGNARTLAIARAYNQNLPGAQAYRDWLAARGYDIGKFRQPVLVRRRLSPLSSADRQAFTREANERSTLSMGSAEQAATDAKGITAGALEAYQGGDLGNLANAAFVRRLMDSIVSPSERGALMTPDGRISQEGLRRLENALFQRAYGDSEVLASLRESADASNIKAIGDGLMRVAGEIAKLRAEIEDGRLRASLEVSKPLLDAARIVRTARDKGAKVADLVRQQDMFSGGTRPETLAALRLFFRDESYRTPRSAKDIAEGLRFYADQARRNQPGPGLFGNEQPIGPADILTLAVQRLEGGLLSDVAESRIPSVTPRENEQRGRAAAEQVLTTRQDAPNAMWRDDLGAISFNYGEPGTPQKQYRDGWGLSHIVARRDLESANGRAYAVETLPRVLAHGRLQKLRGPSNARRADIVYQGHLAVLSLYRHGQRETWVLTGYEKAGAGGTSAGNAGSPYAPSGPRVSPNVGAAPTGNVSPPLPIGKKLSIGEVNKMLSSGDTLPGTASMQGAQPGPRGKLSIGDVERLAQQGETLPDQAMAGPGVNYVGNVPQSMGNVQAGSKATPIRRGAILADLMKVLAAALYEGRIKSANTLGFYRRRIEEIRIKKPGDLETAAHEVAHMLDDRFPEIRRQWTPASNANAAIRAELKGVSYDQDKLYEGFAEFIRLWATQRNQAQAKAPQFHQWWDGWLHSQAPRPVAQALERFQEQAHEWFAQDALTRARSKIGPEPEVNAAQVSLAARLRQSTLDDLEGIRRMELNVRGRLLPTGAYETARLTRGAAEIINGALTLGTLKVKPDGSHTFKGKSLADILKPVQSRLADFEMYAVGRAAQELKAQGRENLFTSAEIAAMLSLERPEFRTAFAEYQDWNGAIIDFAEAKGVINPVARQFWQRRNYLPFHRVGTGTGEGQGTTGAFQPVKELKGGTRNLKDPMQNIIANAAMLIRVALQNEARQKVAGLANMQGGARFMAKIPTEERKVLVPHDQVKKAVLDALQGIVLDPADIDKIVQNIAPITEMLVRGQAPSGDNVTAVLQSGKPVYYEVADPLLFRALESLNRQGRTGLMSFIGAARRLGQTSVTVTPDFAARNFFRDQAMAGIMSQHGYIPFVDGVRGLVSRLRNDQTYKDFIANGGGVSGHVLDEDTFRNQLDRFYQSKGIKPSTVLNTPQRLYEGVRDILGAFEMATRVGEYKRAIRKGEPPRAAAYAAREVSTDFAMRGDAGDVFVKGDAATISFLYDSVMFLKAGINGLDRFYRGVVHDPGKWRTMGLTATLALMSAALYTVNADNPEYDRLEDWDRDMHWHFFVPKAGGGHHHFRLPKLWEVGAIASLAERTMETIRNGWGHDSAKKLFNVVRQSVNLDPVPQALNPVLEVAMNRSRFTGRPIEPIGIQDLEPWARATPATSETMRQLGEATRNLPRPIQISPAQAEHLFRGYLTTWGMYALDLSDTAVFNQTRADKRTDQLPVVRSFYREEPSASNRHIKELYDAIKESHEVRNTMRAMDRAYRPEIADEMENRPENLMHGQLTFAEKRLQVFNREARQVLAARSIDELQKFAIERARSTGDRSLIANAQMRRQWDDLGALKRVLLDDLTRERNTLAETINRDVTERRKELRAGAR